MTQESRIGDWLRSIGGILSALLTGGAAIVAIYASVEGWLAPAIGWLGLKEGATALSARVAALLLLLPVILFVIRSYRRFASASRLERPDSFTLSASAPHDLIGRNDDLLQLQDSVLRNRVVMLDGESGCGKSALVSAGLVPHLLSANGLLPIVIRDWGVDWVRGPLATALHALFDVLTPEQRNRLSWNQPPDLAAEASTLAAALSDQLEALGKHLARRPLLIADQFDDYQARHRERFLDESGNWLKPEGLAAVNPFWALIQTQLRSGALHLLAVTRSDTASGLSCIRFLDASTTADRHLPRVEGEYLRQLLERVAPADATPEVVSHPDQGWHELRERLEADLRLEGPILMQQVRTVILGLRQLPVLTVDAYRRGGGLRGAESMMIARAVRRAGQSVGSGEVGRALARRLLAALALPGGVGQPAKAQRVSFAALAHLAGSDEDCLKVLRGLQLDEVVRPAEGLGADSAWQLDHDYLAHAVLAEARNADQWAIVLHNRRDHFRLAGGEWRRRWGALLPIRLQARLAWERARGRLRYGEAAAFARLSLLKPGVAVVLVSAATFGAVLAQEELLLSAEAARIHDRFGSGEEELRAVMDAWGAPQSVRYRLYRQIQNDEGRLRRAVVSGWPVAHGGVDNQSLLQAMQLLRGQMVPGGHPTTSQLLEVYGRLAEAVSDPSVLQREAVALRQHLRRERDTVVGDALVLAYQLVAEELTDPAVLRQESASLNEHLAGEADDAIAARLAAAYSVVAVKLPNLTDKRRAAATVGRRLRVAGDPSGHLHVANARLSAELQDSAEIQRAAALLLERAEEEPDFEVRTRLYSAYGVVAAKLDDPIDLQQAAPVLLDRLLGDRYDERLSEAYSLVTQKLTDQGVIRREVIALTERLVRGTEPSDVLEIAAVYPTVVATLHDPVLIQQATGALRERLFSWGVSEIPVFGFFMRQSIAVAYAAVAARLSGPGAIEAELAELGQRLRTEDEAQEMSILVGAYVLLGTTVGEALEMEEEASALHERFIGEADMEIAAHLALAYATVVAKSTDAAVVEQAVEALEDRLSREVGAGRQPEGVVLFLQNGQDPLVALSVAYARVASELAHPATIERAATRLLLLLAAETEWEEMQRSNFGTTMGESYALLMSKLTDQSAIQQAAVRLRERLLRTEGGEARCGEWNTISSSRSRAYVSVAARLTDPIVLQQEAEALRERLMGETDCSLTLAFSRAYSVVSGMLIENAAEAGDWRRIEAEVRSLLILTGHPFLTETEGLLGALEPRAGRSFGADVGAAVEWWATEFGGDPTTLRPEMLAVSQRDR